MELPCTVSRSQHLRRSYLEIFRYFHARPWRFQTKSIGPSRPLTRSFRRCSSTKTDFSEPQKRSILGVIVGKYNTARKDDPELPLPTSQSRSEWHRLRHIDSNLLTTADDLESNEQNQIQLYGYLTSKRSAKELSFYTLSDPRLECAVQVVTPRVPFKADLDDDPFVRRKYRYVGELNAATLHSPVCISGSIVRRIDQGGSSEMSTSSESSSLQDVVQVKNRCVGSVDLLASIEIKAKSAEVINYFHGGWRSLAATTISDKMRHMQFRTDSDLRQRLRLRSRLCGRIREHMLENDFDEIETPLLFKSTPEGAREFVVPSRILGHAYALPQSPQQYKQLLMASGISRYFQFARCFRDEDRRADRQPEFTQLDLEMSFAGSFDVMRTVEDLLVNVVWPTVPGLSLLPTLAPTEPMQPEDATLARGKLLFPRLTYQEAMSRYGSDKPDTRFGAEIRRVEQWVSPEVKSMVTMSTNDNVVEMMKIDMQGCEPADAKKLYRDLIESSPVAKYNTDDKRRPGFTVYDPLMPLRGLAYFGHEGAARVEEEFSPEPGDLLVLWAREDNPFTGGSTVLGDLRRDLLQNAISQGLISTPSGFAPLWITDFPLFSPTTESEPGQGGSAGICATHHPFTAPRKDQKLTLSTFLDKPLSIIGDHYDLVINGVEVGGGSCRIHQDLLQEFIFRDVLKMRSENVAEFEHLLSALRCGCPPHAGFALGFDRLMAMLTNRASIRDVIAFPKTADGADPVVGSPSRLTAEQLATYNLSITKKGKKPLASDPVVKEEVTTV